MRRFSFELNDFIEVPYCAETMGFVWQGQTIYNPLRLPDDSGDCSPEFYGFEVWGTGGGNEAHALELADGEYFLLFGDDGHTVDMSSPEDVAAACMVRYDEDAEVVADLLNFAELPRNGSVPG